MPIANREIRSSLRRECRACGRITSRRMIAPGVPHGKQHVRHKCQHGEWCITGHPLQGQHHNHPACRECRRAKGWTDKASREGPS